MKKRVEVLFPPEQFARLAEIACSQGRSVGFLIRQAVETVYLSRQLDEKKAAAAWIIAQQMDWGGDWEDLKKAIEDEVSSYF